MFGNIAHGKDKDVQPKQEGRQEVLDVAITADRHRRPFSDLGSLGG
jgi:hypothetical protein